MARKLIAGIDIGGAKIAVALAVTDGEQVFSERFSTNAANRRPHDILEETVQRIAHASGGEQIAAVGCGCAGPIDLQRGLVMSPPNLPGWNKFPIVEKIREKFAVPVTLEDDANAAALGELEYGAGRGDYKTSFTSRFSPASAAASSSPAIFCTASAARAKSDILASPPAIIYAAAARAADVSKQPAQVLTSPGERIYHWNRARRAVCAQ